MAPPLVNFGLVTVSGGYAAGATSVTLQSGDGSRLPTTTGGYRYVLNWWNATDYAHAADDPNREFVLVTNRAGDVLTLVRGQEGTGASSKNTSAKTYRMSQVQTAGMVEDLRVQRNTHQGLVIQTHRDSDVAQYTVELTACESIVMDDGMALRNDNDEWTGKTASISVSGAGGLDTGVEQSGWYEIHAIAKEDGTRNLILHRSHAWAIDTNNIATEDSSQNLRAAAANTQVAQGFQLSGSGKIVFVEAKLKKVGTPTGYIQCIVKNSSGGGPGGTTLATSHKFDVSRLPSTAMWVRLSFPSTAAVLSSGTQYHMVLLGDWTINGSNYVEWRMDGSAGSYAYGAKSLFDGSFWSPDADDDMMFAVGIELDRSSVVLPTDYTRQCFLGWVYNDNGSNFVPFIQHGRSRRVSRLTADESVQMMSGIAEVIDFSSHVPPIEVCKTLVGFSGTGTQAGVLAIGDLRAWDVSTLGDTTGAQIVLYSGMTSTRPNDFREVMVQRQVCMAQGTDGSKIYVSGFSWE